MFELISETRSLFRAIFPSGEVVVFKPLSYKEWLAFKRIHSMNVLDESLLEEEIFSRSLVNKEVLLLAKELWPAGIITTISSLVMKLSGNDLLLEEDKDRFKLELNLARQRIKEVNNTLSVLICRAFPAYTPEDIDNLSWDKRILRLAQAEEILLRTGFISQPIDLKSPEEDTLQSKNQIKEDLEMSSAQRSEFFDDVEAEEELERRRLAALKRIAAMKQKKS